MGSTQKYSLKWNDFTVNITSTFRELYNRHDFVDVTLACADGSTLEAHKVILSSVSTYFHDVLQTAACTHPIIILRDTGRDEAAAMLEFAYTGEVNVAQELLPSLLETARCLKIKGLDKVESPVAPEPKPPLVVHDAWTAPSSNLTSTIGEISRFSHNSNLLAPSHRNEIIENLTDASKQLSPPPTRETTPTADPLDISSSVRSSSFARTPPPKRWKRSFDKTTQPLSSPVVSPVGNKSGLLDPVNLIPENYQVSRLINTVPNGGGSIGRCQATSNTVYHVPAPKRYCVGSRLANVAEAEGRTLPYPHSSPTSPVMFERGLFRQVAKSDLHGKIPTNAHCGQTTTGHCSTVRNENDDALDYRRFRETIKSESYSPTPPVRNTICAGAAASVASSSTYMAGITSNRSTIRSPLSEESSSILSAATADRCRLNSLVFRPESAPTVLNMSPDGSLLGPPSIHGTSIDLSMTGSGSYGGTCSEGGASEISEGDIKSFALTPGMDHYNCDECGKIFRHPGSLQHHRHIHRGTHQCPSCGKAFSRRWDMERHLNKSKYGCPASRFSNGGGNDNNGGGGPPNGRGLELLSSASHNATL